MTELNEAIQKPKVTITSLVKSMPYEIRETMRRMHTGGYPLETIAEAMLKFPFFQEHKYNLTKEIINAMLKQIYRDDEIDIELEGRKMLDNYESTINTLSLMISAVSQNEGSLGNKEKRKEVLDLMKQRSDLLLKKENLLFKIIENRKNNFEKKDKAVSLLSQ